MMLDLHGHGVFKDVPSLLRARLDWWITKGRYTVMLSQWTILFVKRKNWTAKGQYWWVWLVSFSGNKRRSEKKLVKILTYHLYTVSHCWSNHHIFFTYHRSSTLTKHNGTQLQFYKQGEQFGTTCVTHMYSIQYIVHLSVKSVDCSRWVQVTVQVQCNCM